MKKIFFIVHGVIFINTSIAQNVGIGTTTPLEKLSVVSNGYGISHEFSSIKLSTYINGSGGWIGTVSNDPFHFYTNNGGASMTINTNGNIGIGNLNPSSKLHIYKGSAGGVTPNAASGLTLEHNDHIYVNFLTPDNKECGVLFGLNSNSAHGGIIYNNPSAPGGLLFRTNGNENRMMINQNGNVGIGIANPVNKLEVNGDITANNYKYTSLKTDFVSIGGADFNAVLSSEETFMNTAVPGIQMLNGTYGVIAPVHLPNGATITNFKVYLFDNSVAQDLNVVLSWGDHLAGGLAMASVSSSAAVGDAVVSTNSISNAVIDNTSRYYFISANSSSGSWSNASLRLKRVQITYTITGPD
ncbi:MAG TPA: hypothetical protein PKC62_06845 [Ferruginibacter sp.]|nr:hypothetical protein [Ferruginibacter sp.]